MKIAYEAAYWQADEEYRSERRSPTPEKFNVALDQIKLGVNLIDILHPATLMEYIGALKDEKLTGNMAVVYRATQLINSIVPDEDDLLPDPEPQRKMSDLLVNGRKFLEVLDDVNKKSYQPKRRPPQR